MGDNDDSSNGDDGKGKSLKAKISGGDKGSKASKIKHSIDDGRDGKAGSDPEAWIQRQKKVAHHAIAQFRVLDPKLQHAIMGKGSLAGSRDPTAVLLARMKAVVTPLQTDPE